MKLLGTTYDTPIFLGFKRITSGALQSRCISCVLSILNLTPFACKIPNPGLQIREIQYHEEPIGEFVFQRLVALPVQVQLSFARLIWVV